MLYHAKSGFPFKVNLPQIIKVTYSKHALNEALNDEYGVIDLDHDLQVKEKNGVVLEMETDDVTGNPVKIMIRMDYTDRYDFFVVIQLDSIRCGRPVAKTVWLHPKDNRNKAVNLNNYRRAA